MNFDPTELASLIPSICKIAKMAGEEILKFYNADERLAAKDKPDGTPVTEADLAADRLIVSALKTITPDIPVISEETYTSNTAIPASGRFWLVDPLDGTKDFLGRTGDFCVNIGLVHDFEPSLGVIYAPVFFETYWGIPGLGAYSEIEGKETQISARMAPSEGLTVVSSRYYGNPAYLKEFLSAYKVAHQYIRGSAYKFCEIAGGKADLYPYMGSQNSEWDTAAGQAIVCAAGGSVVTREGRPLRYGKPGVKNPPYQVWGKTPPY